MNYITFILNLKARSVHFHFRNKVPYLKKEVSKLQIVGGSPESR